MTDSPVKSLLSKYIPVRLEADLSSLSDNRRKMLPLLVEAMQSIDRAFWKQSWGDRDALMARIDDADTRRFVEINYSPWDRLDGNTSFVDGIGERPLGGAYYPADMTKEEFEAAVEASADGGEALRSLYTMVQRDENGGLTTVPYHEYFAEEYGIAAASLRAAAKLAEHPGFEAYLQARARAFESDDYQPSDIAWMDMKENVLDVVIGPIENYEDQLFGYKASNGGYILIKDLEWSRRLAHYAALLPALQRSLPVPDAYKAEVPGADSELNAYDVIYYAGDSNAGSKTIAINLPNDDEVQLSKGTRRMQLKNAMRAKFDQIMLPITAHLIEETQRKHVTFESFFGNTMFHEVAHGLGIKNTIDGDGFVRTALKETHTALEEGKADILGLHMVSELRKMNVITVGEPMDDYVTFFAGIFRSVRFGSASAHGVANMIRFNFFAEMGAFERHPDRRTYRVDPERFAAAVEALAAKILILQGDGDYDAVLDFVKEYGSEGSELRGDLNRLSEIGIPTDVVFEQGVDVLGL